MKYKVGDKVRIKSLDWYNQNKGKDNNVPLIKSTNSYYNFIEVMRGLCGKVMTISSVKSNYYDMVEDYGSYFWTDEMIEGLAEEEIRLVDNLSSGWVNEFSLPEDYVFKDENGNIINAQKIVLEKKKKEYPKTYEECYKITNLLKTSDIYGYKNGLLFEFQKLLIARDAYWKIAGEKMRLGKPWKPDWEENSKKSIITTFRNTIVKFNTEEQYTFAFPTEETRDAFYENFKELIEICKELL